MCPGALVDLVTLLAFMEARSQASSGCFAATMVFEVVKRGAGVEWLGRVTRVDLNNAVKSTLLRGSALLEG